MNGGAAEDTSGAAIKKSWGEETHREGKRKKLNAHMACGVFRKIFSPLSESLKVKENVSGHTLVETRALPNVA